ncbi:MAG: DoxX family membrane protein [Rubrobacteraceae bacterium]
MKIPHVEPNQLEDSVTRWLVRYSIPLLRISLGGVFLLFGALKFFPNVSPIEALASRTVGVLTFGLILAGVSMILLAALECAIGIGLLTGLYPRLTLVLLGLQMIGATSPLVIFPGEIFAGPFHAPTLVGQYIIKDVVLISAGLVLGATLRGGRIVTERVRRAEDYRSYPEQRLRKLGEPGEADRIKRA